MPLSRDIYTTTNDFSPIRALRVVTPNDSTDLPDGPCRALILNNQGVLVFDTLNGETVALQISANWFGVTYIGAKRVRATGTTLPAGSIFACY